MWMKYIHDLSEAGRYLELVNPRGLIYGRTRDLPSYLNTGRLLSYELTYKHQKVKAANKEC